MPSIRILITCLLGTLILSASTVEIPATIDVAAASLTPHIDVEGTFEQQALVDDTIAVFVELGMPLPDLTVAFTTDQDACNGFMGLFQPDAAGWRIDICSDLPFVIPHELGHAWERANLDHADQAEYMDARGLEHWRHAKRVEAGVEDVALVIQHIVLGGGSSYREGITEAFDLLTSLADDAGVETGV
jgi:hypothetical protein